jgi:benzoyl-CoA-dihydrodiol lyase
VPRTRWAASVAERATAVAARSARPGGESGIELTPLPKERSERAIAYRYVVASLDRERGCAEITVHGPGSAPVEPTADFWTLAMTRELDDLILDLRTNEPSLGTWVLRTKGDPAAVLAHDDFLLGRPDDWAATEIVLYLKRTLKRLDVTSRSLLALIEPGSCFAGSLFELALAADRSYHLAGVFSDVDPSAAPATVTVGDMNRGPLPMGNDLTRLETRFGGEVPDISGKPHDAAGAEAAGLITFAPDDIDWADEVRIAIEERASFSPDALTGLEANYRFAGPETIETKIFGRLSAWQNWIFNRPNASGPEGALRRFGTGQRAAFDRKRV